jgi:hypothetical protein
MVLVTGKLDNPKIRMEVEKWRQTATKENFANSQSQWARLQM